MEDANFAEFPPSSASSAKWEKMLKFLDNFTGTKIPQDKIYYVFRLSSAVTMWAEAATKFQCKLS